MASTRITLVSLLVSLLVAVSQALECYQCKTNNPNDSCFTSPSSSSKETCRIGAIQKCVVRRTFDTVNQNVIEFERGCELTSPIFGQETGCQTTGTSRECQIVCDADLCNDVAESQVEQCVSTRCRNSASTGRVVGSFVIVLAFFVKLMS